MSTRQLEALRTLRRRPARLALGAAFACALLFGAWRNGVEGPRVLALDHRERTRPALDAVLASDLSTVAVNNQFIAQELALAFDRKRFFRVREPEHLERLCHALARRGEARFLFLTRGATLRPRGGTTHAFGRSGEPGGAASLRFEPRGERGSYELWEGTVTPAE